MDPRRRQASASMSVKSEDIMGHARRASHSGTPLDDEEGEFLVWARCAELVLARVGE